VDSPAVASILDHPLASYALERDDVSRAINFDESESDFAARQQRELLQSQEQRSDLAESRPTTSAAERKRKGLPPPLVVLPYVENYGAALLSADAGLAIATAAHTARGRLEGPGTPGTPGGAHQPHPPPASGSVIRDILRKQREARAAFLHYGEVPFGDVPEGIGYSVVSLAGGSDPRLAHSVATPGRPSSNITIKGVRGHALETKHQHQNQGQQPLTPVRPADALHRVDRGPRDAALRQDADPSSSLAFADDHPSDDTAFPTASGSAPVDPLSEHRLRPDYVSLTPEQQLSLSQLWVSTSMPSSLKIDMMVKYTTSSHHPHLEESLKQWTTCLGLVREREGHLRLLEDFEWVASDPVRLFTDTSTARLVEQRERERLKKRLGRKTQECKEAIGLLFDKYGDVFTMSGVPYMDKMAVDVTEILYFVAEERAKTAGKSKRNAADNGKNNHQGNQQNNHHQSHNESVYHPVKSADFTLTQKEFNKLIPENHNHNHNHNNHNNNVVNVNMNNEEIDRSLLTSSGGQRRFFKLPKNVAERAEKERELTPKVSLFIFPSSFLTCIL
jgi:hypothetical protein